jgi:hypothetical protein
MKNSASIDKNLLAMLKEKGEICVSIIMPTHNLSPERQNNPVELKKAVNQAKEYIANNYKKEQAAPLAKAIDDLTEQVDFTHSSGGLGIFVSAGVQQVIHFSFPVAEKIIVSDSFEVRDIFYEMNYASPYYFLLLTEKDARLFEGRLDKLKEVKDKNFPKEYHESYVYSVPSQGSSYLGSVFTKAFEKDKSILEEIRHQQFFRAVDEVLNDYPLHEKPLLVAAVTKELSSFRKVSHHADKIAGLIDGNYTYNSLPEIEKKVWDKMKGILDERKVQLIKGYEEKIGEGRGVEGLEEVWQAAAAGRGMKLLVEKDFKKPGFVENGDGYLLHLMPPKTPHKTLSDAVDDLIEMVLDKNGEIVLVDNDALKNHQHIALITRY